MVFIEAAINQPIPLAKITKIVPERWLRRYFRQIFLRPELFTRTLESLFRVNRIEFEDVGTA